MSHLCVTPHDRDRSALPGLRLCTGCHDYLGENIADLPGLHTQLGDQLTDATPASDSSGRSSAGRSIPLPINTGIVDHRDQIQHDLIWWAVYVAGERGIAQPTASSPEVVAQWLGRHVDWIAGDETAAEECPGVMRELAGRARSLLDPSGSKRIEIGACHQLVAGPAMRGRPWPMSCAGALYATVRADDDARPSLIYCSACDFSKEPSEWLRFGKTYGARLSA